jgi:hypothetical protein
VEVAQQEGIEAEVLAELDGVRTLRWPRMMANRRRGARAEMGQRQDDGGQCRLELEQTQRSSGVAQCSRVSRRGPGLIGGSRRRRDGRGGQKILTEEATRVLGRLGDKEEGLMGGLCAFTRRSMMAYCCFVQCGEARSRVGFRANEVGLLLFDAKQCSG